MFNRIKNVFRLPNQTNIRPNPNEVVEHSTTNPSNYVFLLDNGHGGVIDGVYQTKGKRSPKFDDGSVLYEGEFNRDVVNRISKGLTELGIEHIVLVPELQDITLGERIRRANKIQQEKGNTVLISVHANAYLNDWNNANGVDVFYLEQDGKFSKTGKRLAELMQVFLVEATKLRDRGAKGRNFYVLRRSSMPAILTENGFMTNKNEARLLMSDEFRQRVANAHINFITHIDRNNLI